MSIDEPGNLWNAVTAFEMKEIKKLYTIFFLKKLSKYKFA